MSLRDKINNGRTALAAGVLAVSAPDLFPTPPDVADRMVKALRLVPGCRVLEPSAGTGALIDAVKRAEPTTQVVAVERDPRLATRLNAACSDFLDLFQENIGGVDRVLMNPPFSGGADIKHVLHALRFLLPGGVLVAIVADGPRQDRAFADAEDLERLPSGTFQGTNVRARIIRFYR